MNISIIITVGESGGLGRGRTKGDILLPLYGTEISLTHKKNHTSQLITQKLQWEKWGEKDVEDSRSHQLHL